MRVHAHGQSEIQWSGNLCQVWLTGPFNVQGAEALLQQIRRCWHLQGEPAAWAELVDLSGWEGRTPDSNEVFNAGQEWVYHHGLRALAMVTDNRMASLLVEISRSLHPLLLQRNDLPVAYFTERDKALTWLASLGFAPNKA